MALVLAAEYYSSIEAEIVHGRLAADGVQSYIFDLGLQGAGTPNSVRLMVEEEDLAQARRILAVY